MIENSKSPGRGAKIMRRSRFGMEAALISDVPRASAREGDERAGRSNVDPARSVTQRPGTGTQANE